MDLAMRRKLTEQTIAMNPSTIELIRTGRISDGAGGWTEGPVDVEAQTFRRYLSNATSRDISSEGGELHIKMWELLGAWDADIKRGDTFEFDGVQHKVVTVNPIRYKSEVVSYQAVVEEVS